MTWALFIGEKGGSWAGRPSRVTLHETREEAEQALEEYVAKGNVDAEFVDPEVDAVKDYFENQNERYEIAPVLEGEGSRVDIEEARSPMSYPDPKLVEEARRRGIELPNPRVVMGPPLQVDPKTGKVTLANSTTGRAGKHL